MLANPLDLIISDIDMPFLDGFELLSLLKTEESTASIPVILLSGRGDSDNGDVFLEGKTSLIFP